MVDEIRRDGEIANGKWLPCLEMSVLSLPDFFPEKSLGGVNERLSQLPDVDRRLLRQPRHQPVMILVAVANQCSVHGQLRHFHGSAFSAEGQPDIQEDGSLSSRQLNAGATDLLTSFMQNDLHASPLAGPASESCKNRMYSN